MTDDRVIGTAKNLGGKAQEAFGHVTGDTKSQVEGVIKPGGRSGAGSLWSGKRDGLRCRPSDPPRRGGCRGLYPPYDRKTSLYNGDRSALCRLDYWSHGSARLVGLTVTEMRTSVSGASFSFRMILCVVLGQ